MRAEKWWWCDDDPTCYLSLFHNSSKLNMMACLYVLLDGWDDNLHFLWYALFFRVHRCYSQTRRVSIRRMSNETSWLLKVAIHFIVHWLIYPGEIFGWGYSSICFVPSCFFHHDTIIQPVTIYLLGKYNNTFSKVRNKWTFLTGCWQDIASRNSKKYSTGSTSCYALFRNSCCFQAQVCVFCRVTWINIGSA